MNLSRRKSDASRFCDLELRKAEVTFSRMSGSFSASLHKYGNGRSTGTGWYWERLLRINTWNTQLMKEILWGKKKRKRQEQSVRRFRAVTAVLMGVFCFENGPCFLELARPTRKVFCGSVTFAYTFLRVFFFSGSLVFVYHLLSGKSCPPIRINYSDCSIEVTARL